MKINFPCAVYSEFFEDVIFLAKKAFSFQCMTKFTTKKKIIIIYW